MRQQSQRPSARTEQPQHGEAVKAITRGTMQMSRPEGKARPHPRVQASLRPRGNLQQRRGATAPHRPGQSRASIALSAGSSCAAAASIGASTLPVRCNSSTTLLPSSRCGPAGVKMSGYPSTGARTVQRGLTLRSRRGPTALHLARAALVVHDALRGQGAIPLVPPHLKR